MEFAGKFLSFSEKKNNLSTSKQYVYDSSRKTFLHIDINKTSEKKGIIQAVIYWFQNVFLPQGYPDSVSSDYLSYQIWDSAQAFCSSIASALSLKATLIGLGVGQEAASPVAATITWLIKDGSGMITSIAFAYWQGGQLDCNGKQWRLFADVANDFCHFLQLLSPFLPVPFLVTLSFSSVLLSLVGVAGGATRAALTVHQARYDNMADVSAKDGSQETLVNLLALLFSMAFLPLIAVNAGITWLTFIVCVVLHLYFNYCAMRALDIKVLNQPRFLYVLEKCTLMAYIPTTKEANLNEPLLHGPAFIRGYLHNGYNVKLGFSFKSTLDMHGTPISEKVIEEYMETLKKQKFLLLDNEHKKKLYIVFHKDASSLDELCAYWSAFLYSVNSNLKKKALTEKFVVDFTQSQNAAKDASLKAVETFPQLLTNLKEKGWITEKNRLGIEDWRVH